MGARSAHPPLYRLALPAALLLASLLLPMPAAAHAPPAEAPPDAFCIVVIEPLDGFRQVRVTVDEELSAAAKDASWEEANANRDAVLSPQEAESFRLGSLRFWPGGRDLGNRSLHLEPGAPYQQVTPVRPVYAATWRHLGHGFYEDAASSHTGAARGEAGGYAAFETQAVREYAFHVPDQVSRMTLHGGRPDATAALWVDANVTYLPKPVIEYVVLKAPEGWRIRQVSGFGYNGSFQQEADTDRLELRGFDTSAPWTITYLHPEMEETLGSLGGPGFEALGLAAACLLPAAWLRRRAAGRRPRP